MRILKTEIWIDNNNQWWANQNQIVNEGVLKLFKMNLHFDEDYFIYLSSGTQEEKGYLKSIEGFPLICEDIEFQDLDLPVLKIDNDQTLELTKIYYDTNRNAFWGVIPDKEYRSYLPFIFSNKVLQLLQPFFIEENEKQFLLYRNQTIPIIFRHYDPYNIRDLG